MKKINITLFVLIIVLLNQVNAQVVTFENREFELSNVKASVVIFNGQQVLKVERDLEKLPFDSTRMESTVDEPTFVKLKDLNFENGTIEVKMYSQIQKPSPFKEARGFIGLTFRVDDTNTTFESIYLRPTNGRSENQVRRNHTVQYYSYPDYKFNRLRTAYPEMYETYANIGLEEWITMRIKIQGEKVYLYLNNLPYPAFIVDKTLGNNRLGSIGLWIDIGTIGYFKELKITKD
ncbi:MAG TPA: hypothetical protein VN040_04025 [Pseudosphingobacterium sp.]|nr:hypothetical protein [Pseudosphingobacterium sp.]